MMRTQSCFAILLVLSLFACHQRQPVAPGSLNGIPDRLASSVTGTYSGHYSKGLITLVINYISGYIVSGYDVHKGLRRNLNGAVEQIDGHLIFELKEPGGNPYDGTFFINLDTVSGKITGKWIPTDSTKAHAGPLDLARSDGADREEYSDEWGGDLGTLTFQKDGICTLEYYPTRGGNSQLITVTGSYEVKGNTFRIDWQRNDHTPVLNMKLIQQAGTESTDSTAGSAPRLVGNGVEFVKRTAG